MQERWRERENKREKERERERERESARGEKQTTNNKGSESERETTDHKQNLLPTLCMKTSALSKALLTSSYIGSLTHLADIDSNKYCSSNRLLLLEDMVPTFL